MLVYILLILFNILTFITFGIDKFLAIKHSVRTSEYNLLSLIICGGAIGGILGMYIFRHKTKKPKFIIGGWLCMLLEIILLYYCCSML